MRRIAGALCLSAAAANGGVMYGVGEFAPFGTQSLYRIDSSTGAATMVGDTGIAEIIGLEWDGARILAYTADARLYGINSQTGASRLLGAGSNILAEGDLTMVGGQLYATTTGEAYSIDATGQATLVASYGDPFDFSAAFTVGTTSYAVNSWGGFDDYIELDLATGASSAIGTTGITGSSIGGADYDEDTSMAYLSDGSTLYSVNVADGASSMIGDHGVTGVSGLVVIPAPATLLAMVGAFASRRRR